MKESITYSSEKSLFVTSSWPMPLLRLLELILLASLPSIASAQPGCTPPPAGLIGWWRGQDNGNDRAGTNNALALVNMSFTNGIVGRAFAFDPQDYPFGTYTGVKIADQPYYALTHSLSIEAWIRPRGPGYVVFYRGDNRVGLDPYALSTGLDNILHFTITDASGNSASVSALLTYNQWWHVAGTLDGATGKMNLYTNGNLAAQITTTVRPFGALIPERSPGIGIGNVNDGFNNFPFHGDIDEVSLYNRALSDAEIAAIYSADGLGKCQDLVRPFIVAQPASQIVGVGETAGFSVTALGAPSLSYQWKLNGASLGAETKSSLTISNAQTTNAGTYSVEITNRAGAVTSADALLAVHSQSGCAVPTSGLVSWWRAEGNAQDSVDGASGTLYGGVTFAPGKVGQCFAFDGSNGGINVPDVAALALTKSLTVEGWLFVTNPPTSPGMVLFRGDTRSGLDPYYVLVSPGAGNSAVLSFAVYGADDSSTSVFAPMPLGSWTHVAGTLDDATGLMTLYTNGVVAHQQITAIRPLGPLDPGSGAGLGIGNHSHIPGPFNYPFRGRIDELAVFNLALTAAEIGAIVGAGETGKCHEPPVILLQPTDRRVAETSNATFTVTATGTPLLAYQWRRNGADIAGETTTALALSNVSDSNAGSYSVRVTNLFGAATSFDAVLSVNHFPVANCANVVIRAGTNCLADTSVDNGSFDPDNDPIAVSQVPPGPYPVGTNVVTLVVTDSYGASNSCSAIVIVQDRTPPTIACPGAKVLEFQNETGATATYAATASDFCSAVTIVGTPPSGSLFPVGVTPVLVRATDGSSNQVECRFTVIVLGAQGVKSNVLAELIALRSGASLSESFGQKFGDAIEHLAASLTPAYWIDQTHLQFKCGNAAMNEEKLAAKTLEDVMDAKACPVERAVLQGLADRIVKCDRILAIISIQEAARTRLNPKKVEQDLEMVGKGDREADAGHYANAIEHYRNAWRHALQLQVQVGLNTEGKMRLQFVGNNSKSYQIEVSTDMVNWSLVGTTKADGDGNVEFTDPSGADQSARFYRAVEQ